MYNIISRFTDSGHSVEIGYLDRIDVGEHSIRRRIRSEWGEGGERGDGRVRGGGGRREVGLTYTIVRTHGRSTRQNVHTELYVGKYLAVYVRAKMKIL